MGKTKEAEIRTFTDNILEEIFECSLTSEEKSTIIDLVLERVAEVFVAYANHWQPGAAFMPFHVANFIRELKDDYNRFGPKRETTAGNPQLEHHKGGLDS